MSTYSGKDRYKNDKELFLYVLARFTCKVFVSSCLNQLRSFACFLWSIKCQFNVGYYS